MMENLEFVGYRAIDDADGVPVGPVLKQREVGGLWQSVYRDSLGEYWGRKHIPGAELTPIHRNCIVFPAPETSIPHPSGSAPDIPRRAYDTPLLTDLLPLQRRIDDAADNRWRDITDEARVRFNQGTDHGAEDHDGEITRPMSHATIDGDPVAATHRLRERRLHRPMPTLRYEHPEPLQIVGFIGGIGEGKSTAADHLVARYGYRMGSFGLKLKQIVQDVFGLPYEAVFGDQIEKALPRPHELGGASGRTALEDVGEALRGLNPDVFVNVAKRVYARGRVAFPDVRYPNEAAWIKETGGTLVRVIRYGHEPSRTGADSDAYWPTLPFDYSIVAADVAELHERLDVMIDWMLRRRDYEASRQA